MGMQGLSIATSGLRNAHAQLGVTGHNMSNAEIRGFSRQRIIQHQAIVRNKGMDAAGNAKVLGLGTDRQAVQQLRNEFLDFTYRHNVGRLTFYHTLASAGREIENILGELYGAYNFQGIINDMWFAIQELTRHPDGFATRQLLLSTANSFINKAQEVYEGLFREQQILNGQVIETVHNINALVARVHNMNVLVNEAELAGDNANDFRDARNLALDELAQLIPIETRVGTRGEINISSMGHEMLAAGVQNVMGLRFVSADVDFVIPVLGTNGTTISANTEPGTFVPFMQTRPFNDANNNDFGKLHALIVARGMAPAHHMSNQVPPPYVGDFPPDDAPYMPYRAAVFNHQLHEWSINHGMIPRVMQNLDGIVHAMVGMLNDALTGQLREANPGYPTAAIDRAAFVAAATSDEEYEYLSNLYDRLGGGRYRFVFRCDDDTRLGYPHNHQAPWDLDGNAGGVPLFIRNPHILGALQSTPIDIDPADKSTVYTIRNLMINPALLQPGGHNLLALSMDRDAVNDTRVLEALQTVWRANSGPYTIEMGGRTFRVQEAYIHMVNQIAIDVNEAMRFTEAQSIQVIQADQRRLAIKGVSMDEELAAMLRFQYAFQAASRVVNMIDGMLGVLVNLGRN